MYSLSVEHMLCEAFVRRLGHVFRQGNSALRKFHEFDWNEFCKSKRVSTAYSRMSRALSVLGIDFEGTGSSGGSGTREAIGAPCRLWHPWFVAMREHEGLGWLFEKTDRQRINERVQLLVDLFVRARTAKQLALPFESLFGPLHDRRALAISDR